MQEPVAYFSADYVESRTKFLDAAKGAGARIEAYRNPNRGPEGGTLFTDTAWLGPMDAKRVLVTLSATHGVEGFCGSAVQSGSMAGGLGDDLPSDTALLSIHAINPYGFAWLRRVTEDNVDLNRNFIDFDAPYPANPGYEELADAICPRTWDEATILQTAKRLADFGKAKGAKALQSAISGGQYIHPDGIFFGGHGPTWSHLTLKAIFEKELANAERVAVIDYHTGLGPRGHGERICVHAPGSDGLKRAEAWYGGDVTSPAQGSSVSVVLSGHNVIGMEEAAPQAAITAVAVEYGTIRTELVRLALRADNWLHLYSDPDTAMGKRIKRQIREAFYQDADDWKKSVWERAIETQNQALKGLSSD
jgi:hypothetical protein